MDNETRAAFERLLRIALTDAHQANRVANFILAWWNAESLGGSISPTSSRATRRLPPTWRSCSTMSRVDRTPSIRTNTAAKSRASSRNGDRKSGLVRRRRRRSDAPPFGRYCGIPDAVTDRSLPCHLRPTGGSSRHARQFTDSVTGGYALTFGHELGGTGNGGPTGRRLVRAGQRSFFRREPEGHVFDLRLHWCGARRSPAPLGLVMRSEPSAVGFKAAFRAASGRPPPISQTGACVLREG
jgi:hypothetical protein